MGQGYPPAATQQVIHHEKRIYEGIQMPNNSMSNGGYWPQQQSHEQYRQMTREQWIAAQEHRMQVLREHMEQARYQLYMIDSQQAPPNNRDYVSRSTVSFI